MFSKLEELLCFLKNMTDFFLTDYNSNIVQIIWELQHIRKEEIKITCDLTIQ